MRRSFTPVMTTARKISAAPGLNMNLRTVLQILSSFLSLLLGLSAIAQSSDAIQYFYDDLGRLSRVVDQNGKIATYSYDAVGNLLSISRSLLPANNGLTVLNVMPVRGKIGQQVVVTGQGFNPAPAADQVTFNGVPAAIVTASSTQLVVTVPDGSSTGPLAVTVGGITAPAGSIAVPEISAR